jgi:hypothetical protein
MYLLPCHPPEHVEAQVLKVGHATKHTAARCSDQPGQQGGSWSTLSWRGEYARNRGCI